ncbi:GTP cyclohydrolase I FolE, partial [Salmonella enterica]|nr:GTP cyclohydrolase I FolE [Salmonella enterica]
MPHAGQRRHTCRRTRLMPSLSKEAALVHDALVARGL